MRDEILAVAFDCYGTLVDFGDASFAAAYEHVCANQGLAVDGRAFFEKWMEVWRRLADAGQAADAAIAVAASARPSVANEPGPLSETEVVPPHPDHHTPSAGRSRALNGPRPPFRPYRDEWPEHFAICFEELGVAGDPHRAYRDLRDLLGAAPLFPEARRIVDEVRARLPVALLSNADDDFLQPVLARNGLTFPLVVSSESARAYKPHAAIFAELARGLGLPPANILYVGDSRLADVAGAKNAGMQAVWVNRKGTQRQDIRRVEADLARRLGSEALPEPDFEVASLDGLLALLDGQDGR